MNGFVFLAGASVVVLVVLLVLPLLRRDSRGGHDGGGVQTLNAVVLREQLADLEQELTAGELTHNSYDKSRQEIERRALEEVSEVPQTGDYQGRRPWLAIWLAVCVPAVVAGLYLYLGSPGALYPDKNVGAANEGGHALGQQQIVAMVERLAERLQDNPNDGGGWLMLAKSYGVMGRFPESAAAYGRAITLLPPDAQVLADFADTVAMSQGRKLSGEPERIVLQALTVDPNNIKALALSGTAAFERQDFRGAIAEWQKILVLVPEGSQAASGIQNSIRAAEARLAPAEGSGGRLGGDAAPTATGISGTVALDPTLAGMVGPRDTLFIFARAADGPRMPVAISRVPATGFPVRFLLDDSMSMTPNFRLSQQKQVVVGARISKSGDAQPRSGDLEGFSATISPGAQGVLVVVVSEVK
jgi:cytochrome c-type biogenesis protein CcmH